MTIFARSSLKQLAMATMLMAVTAFSQAAPGVGQHASAAHRPKAAVADASTAKQRAGAARAAARHRQAKASAKSLARAPGHHASAVKPRHAVGKHRMAARHRPVVAKTARHPVAHARQGSGLSRARHPATHQAAVHRVR